MIIFHAIYYIYYATLHILLRLRQYAATPHSFDIAYCHIISFFRYDIITPHIYRAITRHCQLSTPPHYCDSCRDCVDIALRFFAMRCERQRLMIQLFLLSAIIFTPDD